jgi:hypothetical protein
LLPTTTTVATQFYLSEVSRFDLFFHFLPVRRILQKSSWQKLVNLTSIRRKIHCRRPEPPPTPILQAIVPTDRFTPSGLRQTEKRERILIFNFESPSRGAQEVSLRLFCVSTVLEVCRVADRHIIDNNIIGYNCPHNNIINTDWKLHDQ